MPAGADAVDSCFFGGSLRYCVNNGPGTLGPPGRRCTTTCVDPTDPCLNANAVKPRWLRWVTRSSA